MTMPMCADCAGFDLEWMKKCPKHGCETCRGCSCPCCLEEEMDGEDYYIDGDGVVTAHDASGDGK